jgi:hypothetical protein
MVIALHTYIKNIDDIGVRQTGCRLGLPMEFVDELSVALELLMEYLHRHGTVQQLVPGPVDICHTAPSYELQELIALM